MTGSEYQAFIKENFQRVKQQHNGESLGALMGVLGKLYREQKQEKEDSVDSLANDMAAVALASEDQERNRPRCQKLGDVD
jgi:hypothetical protein